MNKFRYRIVFNQARGCLMAVAETAASQGKGTAGECLSTTSVDTQRTIRATLTNLGLACKLLAGSLTVWLPLSVISPLGVQAQTVATRIVADPTAPSSQRPTVLTTSNGVVQVDIRTPSAAGVSRNTYRQFDVGATGAILNNSRTSVQTQQGGWVQGNPWLAKGSARVILNEVNSNNPSYLQGYVEVTGQRAQVIIANPSGIAINGGGFINASGVTLTTGTSNLNTGVLESFRVQGGQITVDGLGLETRGADYTAILSRAAQVNAGIWAQQLQVVTGVNDIPATSVGADTQIQSTLVTSTAAAPAYALDVATLGGMYAGKIQLIGTEAGLGVRNAGSLQASSGPLTLNLQGWLSNSGSMQASGGDVQIQTQDRIDQSGTLYSDKNVQLISNANQNHSGTTAALGDVSIRAMGLNADGTAANIQATKTSAWSAGLQTEGQISGQQNLMVQASGQIQTAGQALASQTLSMQASSLDLAQSRQQATTVILQAISGDLQATGSRILVGQNLRLEAAKTLTTDQAEVQAQTLTLQANALSNKAGQITQTGSTEQSIRLQGTLDNTAGVIYSAAHTLNISAQSIDNTAGQILHAGQGTLAIVSQNQLTNLLQSSIQAAVTDGARIIGAGSLHLQAQDFSNSGSIYAAHDLSSTAKSLTNSGSLYAGGAQTLTVTEAVQSSGTIAAAKDLAIQADNLSGTSTSVLAAGMAADGQLSGTGALTISTPGALQSVGQLLATSGMSLAGSSLYLAGSQTGTTAGDVSLIASSGDINTRQAQVSTPGKLSITANGNTQQTLDNSAGVLSAGHLSVRVGQLNNTQGQIQQTGTGAQTAHIQTAGNLDNTDGSILANAQDFTLSAAGQLDNTDGQIGHAGTGKLILSSVASDNSRGKVLSNGSLAWTATADVNNTSGLVAAKSLDIAAAGLNNSQGQLLSTQADVGLRTHQNSVNNNSGLIQSAQDLSLNLTGGSNSLSNRQGKIYAGRDATLATGALNNDAALIAAGRHLSLDTHGQSLSNLGSRSASTNGTSTALLGLIAGAQMDIGSGALDNTSGLISAQMALKITNTDAVSNAANQGQSGLIYSGTDLSLQANGLDNTGGQILAVQNASLQTGSGSLTNTSGLVRVGQTLTLQAGSVDNSDTRALNSDGSPKAMGLEGNTITISTAKLNNTQGAVRAAQDLNFYTNGQLSNEQGELSAGRKLQITTAQTKTEENTPTLRINNQAGQIVADQSVNVRTGRLSGAGTIASKGDVSLSLQGDHTVAGNLQAGGNLSLSATGEITNPVSVQAGKNLSVLAQSLDNQATGELFSGQTTSVQVAGTLTNRGLIDGADTRIQAGTVNNLGTGRIYGDRIAINASTLTNQEETISGVTKAATIAGRERVDMGVQNLTNQENALVFSGGDMDIGGTLDANWRATGTAQTVNNNSATVEATKDLSLGAQSVRNTDKHWQTQIVQTVGPVSLMYIQPSGSDTKIDINNLYWEGWSRAGQYRYDTTPVATEGLKLGKTPIPELGETPETSYPASDPAWAYFGLTLSATPPAEPTFVQPVTPDPSAANFCLAGAGYDGGKCNTYTQAQAQFTAEQVAFDQAWATYRGAQTAWEELTGEQYLALAEKISAYNAGFGGAVIRSWTQYQVTRTESQSQVVSSAPSLITAAGAIHLQGGQLLNDKSHIVAGTVLLDEMQEVNNVQGEGQHIVNESGTAEYTTSRWRGGFKRYHQRDWYGQTPYKPAAVEQTISLNAARYDQNTANASANTAPTASSVTTVQVQASVVGAVGKKTNTTDLIAEVQTSTTRAPLAQASATAAAASNAKLTSTQMATRTIVPNTQVPTTSLFKTHPEAQAKYFVETDPQFTQFKTWLGSDFMTAQLQFDPATSQKRMGDGFYEQKLVREQVQALTGQRFLGDYANDEAQYMALMNNGLTTAKALQLRPGIALSATQVAQLTSDMVWLVTQEVTLPDGSKQSVLVPQVYVRIKDGDVDGTGALLAGKDVQLNLTGDVSNSGTIAGRNLVSINAQNIKNLGGQISADTLALNAQQDIDNIGGQMQAQSAALLSAGRDINLRTTTQSSANRVGNNSFTQTGIDRVAGLYVSGPAGVLIASAGRDINLTAAQIQNTGTGATSLSAANNLNLNTVTTATSQNINWDSKNHLRQSQSQDVGSQINTAGTLTLSAGQDLNAKAASVNATGTLSAVAGNNVNITQGQASQSLDEAHQTTSKGFLSSKTTTTRTSSQSTTAVSSNLEGASVSIAAGQELSIKGSNVLADQSVNLSAGRNTSIEATQNTRSSSSFTETKKSGLMSGGGLSITIGKQQQSLDQGLQQSTVAASTVGAINGNVTIKAGGAYTQTGSDVLTPGGNIAITAQKVDITEARETGSQSTEQKFKQSGLTVALSGGVIDTAQAAMQGIQGATGGGSDRSKALNALIAYGKGTDLYEQGKAVSDAYDKNGVLGNTGADGKANPGATAASGIKISIGLGGSTSQSNSNTITNRGAGSTVKAGGSVNIQATGQGPVDGDLTVQGSKVQAAQNTTLSATKDVNIVASSDTETNRITNKSSAASVGVSFGIGPGSAGLSLDIAASKGKGQANADSTNYTNSQIEAGQKVSISSGADTNVVGGSIKATQVTASVGGNLNIQSLQDTATSQASQKTTGVALSIPIAGAGGSASISQAKQGSNSNYASVNEQSGIQAGDGGFQVNVKNNTDLKGASIVSTASADKNSLSTGTLTTSDISNSMSASASSSGFSMGTNMLDGKYALAKTVAGNAMNKGTANQSDASSTATAISAAQVTVNGKTTDTSKDQLTDSNVKSVSTDTGNTKRTLAKADVAGLQQQAQQKQADNMLVFKAATAFTDEAYRTMYKAGAQMYKVPPGCSDKSCAVALTEQEAMALKTSQDGKVHLSNNGIFNDLDGAVKYAQQHGGTINVDDSKNYSEKPESQYIIFAPQTNNVLSELIVAGVQKSGLTPTVGLTNAEEQTATRVQQAIQQGQSIVIDSHSRGALTTDNALWSIHNQVGSKDETGNTTKADVQLNNYGGAQSNETGNKTLQQVTGNGSAQINSVIHTKDLIGESVLVGRNPTSPQYTSTAADGTKTTVEAKDDGRNPISNAINIMTGTATPHNCYGTAGGTEGCTKQWDNIPTSNAPKIEPNANYRPSVVIPQYQQVDKVTPQFKQDSNSQMNQLLQPVGPQESSTAPPPNRKLEILQNFKKGL